MKLHPVRIQLSDVSVARKSKVLYGPGTDIVPFGITIPGYSNAVTVSCQVHCIGHKTSTSLGTHSSARPSYPM